MAQTEALCWRVHLAARQPGKAAAAAVVILAAGVLVHLGWPDLPLAPVTMALLFLSASEFFLPIHYRLTDAEVTMRAGLSLRRMAWAQVRRWADDGQGVRLSPLAGASRLQAFRSVYLWLPEDPEPVLRAIRTRLGAKGPGASDAG